MASHCTARSRAAAGSRNGPAEQMAIPSGSFAPLSRAVAIAVCIRPPWVAILASGPRTVLRPSSGRSPCAVLRAPNRQQPPPSESPSGPPLTRAVQRGHHERGATHHEENEHHQRDKEGRLPSRWVPVRRMRRPATAANPPHHPPQPGRRGRTDEPGDPLPHLPRHRPQHEVPRPFRRGLVRGGLWLPPWGPLRSASLRSGLRPWRASAVAPPALRFAPGPLPAWSRAGQAVAWWVAGRLWGMPSGLAAWVGGSLWPRPCGPGL